MVSNKLPVVDIILATYNGEKYLSEQIESLINQSYREFRVVIHDDGSTDNTVNIIKGYRDDYPDKITFIEDGLRFGSSKTNFSHLMCNVDPDYVFFCDQDDVWEKDKIELLLEEISRLEGMYPGKPLLVHSDLKVVDERLRVISNSFFKSQKILKDYSSLDEALVHNKVTGCSLVINNAALKISRPVPEMAIMHDWWVTISVMFSGGIIYRVDKPLVLYRQHQNNTLGAIDTGVLYYLRKMLSLASLSKENNKLHSQAMLCTKISRGRVFCFRCLVFMKRIIGRLKG